MTTLATPAYGFLIKMGNAAGDTFTTIAELRDAKAVLAFRQEDTTAHTQGAPWETNKVTTRSINATLPVNWIPTAVSHGNASGVLAVANAGEERIFQILYPNGGPTWYGKATIGKIEISEPVHGVQQGSIEFKGTGSWTLA